MRFLRSLNGGCPICPPMRGFTYLLNEPRLRTCRSCHVTYLYEPEDVMPVCSVCDQGFTACLCHLKLPKIGRVVKVTQRLEGAVTKTFEGPVAAIHADNGVLKSFALGVGGYQRLAPIQRIGEMIEDATWEIVLPPEPPNKSVWVCPAGDHRGKVAIWRRLDHLAVGRPDRWFYPGSVAGATWEQINSVGVGYLLDPNSAVQNG